MSFTLKIRHAPISVRPLVLDDPTDRMSTGEAWNGIMHDCMVIRKCVLYRDPASGEESYLDFADPTWEDKDEMYWTNQCTPSSVGAIIYFCAFIILCAFVMLNLVIAVILDNFQSQGHEDEAPVSKENMTRFTEAGGVLRTSTRPTLNLLLLLLLLLLLPLLLLFRASV